MACSSTLKPLTVWIMAIGVAAGVASGSALWAGPADLTIPADATSARAAPMRAITILVLINLLFSWVCFILNTQPCFGNELSAKSKEQGALLRTTGPRDYRTMGPKVKGKGSGKSRGRIYIFLTFALPGACRPHR